MASRILEIIFNAKDNASAVLKTAEGNVTAAADRMSGVLKALGGAAAAFAVGKFFADSVKSAMEAERSIALLSAALKPLGINYDNVRGQTEQYLTTLQRTTRFGDDEYRDALRRMVVITGDYNKSLAMLPTAAGLAIETGRELTDAAQAVGKAMNGNVREFQRLFPEIKLVGDASEFLRQKFEQLAYEDGKTLESQVIQLRNAWDDFQESVGMAILGTDSAEESVGRLTEKVIKMQEAVERNEYAIGQITDAVGWFAEKVANIGTTAALGWLGIVQVVRAAIGQLIGWTAVGLEGVMTPLRAFGVDAGKEMLAGLKATGLSMQEEARASVGRLHGVEIAATLTLEDAKAKIAKDRAAWVQTEYARQLQLIKERDQKDLEGQKKHDGEKAKATKEAQREREREAEKHERELLKIAEEIAVKRLQLEEGLTEQQAKEAVRRKTVLGETLDVTVQDYRDGYRQLDEANLLLAAGFDKTVTPAVKRTTEEVKPLTAVFSEALPEAFKLTEEQYDVLADKLRKGQLRDDLDKIGTHKQTFLDLAENIGLMDDKTRAVAESMYKVVESVGRLSLGDPSAWLGVLESLAGVIGQLFGGESPEERARKELLRKNNAALEELARTNGELVQLSSPGRVVSGASAAIRDVLADPQIRSRGGIRSQDLLAALTSRGVNLTDFEELAKGLGINFRTGPRGEITTGGLQALLSGIGAADTAFPTTFTGQLERIRKGVELGAIGSQNQLGEVLSAVSSQGQNAITAALSGLNLNTAEGRAEGVTALRDLFSAFARGDILPGNLGGLTGGEFLTALGDLIGLLQDETQVLAPNRDPFGRPSLDLPTPDRDYPNPFPQFPDASDLTSGFDSLGHAFGDLTVSFEDFGQQQVDYLASIDMHLGSMLERWTDIDTGRAVQATQLAITVGEVNVQTAATDAAGTGEAVQAAVTAAINQALADAYLDRQLATGNVTRTVT